MTNRLDPTDFDYFADEAPDPLYEALMAGDTGDQVTTLEALLARPAWHALAATEPPAPEPATGAGTTTTADAFAAAANVAEYQRTYGTDRHLDRLLPLLGLPDGIEQRVNGHPASPGTQNARSLQRQLDKVGAHNLLVRIARDEIAGIELDLATDLDTLRRRHQAATNAQAAPLPDPNEQKRRVAPPQLHILR